MIMKIMRKTFSILSIFMALAIILGSCSGNKNKTGSDSIDTVADKASLVKEVFQYPIPTSFEVTNMLIDAKAPFILLLCNPAENVSKYITQSQKAVNLGIYGADLCYSSTYNQSQETMAYLNASKKLIEDLSISTTFNNNLVQRIESNLQNKDSLIAIISDSFYDTYNYLMQNKQDKVSVLIMSGSWVEALYISTQISMNAKKDEKLVAIVASHMNALNKLNEILAPLKDDNEVAPIYKSILDIKTLFDSYNTKKLSEKQVAELNNLVTKVRDGLVK